LITVDDLRGVPLFHDLPDSEASAVASRLADIHLRAGDWLIHEGEQPSFFLLLDGTLEVFKLVHGIERRLDEYRPGVYFGEVPLLLGSPAIASLRAKEASRVAQLEPSDFRSMFAECSVFASELVGTMTTRVARLQRLAQDATPPRPVVIKGHRFDVACHRIRDFLRRNHVPYEWEDLAHSPPREDERYPLVTLADGRRLVTPALRDLAEGIGLPTRPGKAAYDVVIVGAGPAGLAAAVYGASEGLSTLLVEREAPGGQAGTSSRIENYLGFPTGLSGDDLATRALSQARRFGAELLVARGVDALALSDGGAEHTVVLDGGEPVRARAIVLASGVSWRELDVPGAERLVGRGIYYGAAQTEARGCQGERVYLIGGGNSAGQAAMFFAGYASEVKLLVRGRSLADSMSHYLIEQLATKSNIEVCTQCRIVQVHGDHRLEGVTIDNRATGKQTQTPASAVFAFIGADARADWLPSGVIRDDKGFVCTGRDVMDLVAQRQGRWPLARDPFLLETSVPGVFAAGDVRHGSVKRVASGVGEGSMAIAFIHQYLAS
jgi:thioredoxin reductase (NADPH)